MMTCLIGRRRFSRSAHSNALSGVACQTLLTLDQCSMGQVAAQEHPTRSDVVWNVGHHLDLCPMRWLEGLDNLWQLFKLEDITMHDSHLGYLNSSAQHHESQPCDGPCLCCVQEAYTSAIPLQISAPNACKRGHPSRWPTQLLQL